jgi:hypothetical protein
MSSGDGGGLLESFSGEGNFFENLGSDVLNLGLGAVTYGTVGYKDGKIQGGATVEGAKVLTGAKAAEDANDQARKQFEDAKAQAEQDRLNSIAQTGKDEMRKSQMAGAARSTAASRSTNKAVASSSGGGSLTLGGDEKDFLGL